MSGLPDRRRPARTAGCVAAAALFLGLACTMAPGPSPCQSTVPGLLAGGNRRVLVTPLAGIRTQYRDNTQAKPDTQFTDSFLIAAANTFLAFEVGRYCEAVAGDTAMAALLAGPSADTAGGRAALVRALAESSGVDLVVVAVACTAGYRVFQPEGWRHNTGPGYARPVESTGFARLRVQILDRDGALFYECTGKASVGKPMLYGMFNLKRRKARREEELRTDVVKAARRLYAPPIVRALGKAARNALPYR